MFLKYMIDEYTDFTFEREVTKETVIRYAFRKVAHLEISKEEFVLVIYGVLLSSYHVQRWEERNEKVERGDIEKFISSLNI